MKNYLLFNSKSSISKKSPKKNELLTELKKQFNDLIELDLQELDESFFTQTLKNDDIVILTGGDGTINRYLNRYKKYHLKNETYFYSNGTGNDFIRDINEKTNLIHLNKYLENTPKVIVNGKESYFINNVGFGVDGDTCVVADELKEKGKKKISYPKIAIKLLLFKCMKCDADIIVDGKKYQYKNVFLASTFNGRYYGGGIMAAPEQNRFDNNLTLFVFEGLSRILTLLRYKSVFKGKHVKYKCVHIIKGKQIFVKFNHPVGLQVDGEVYKDITSYRAYKM